MSFSSVSRTTSAISGSIISIFEDEDTLSPHSTLIRLSEAEEEEIGEIEFTDDGTELWFSEKLDEEDAKRYENILAIDLRKPLKLTKSLNELTEEELYVTLCRKFQITPISNYRERSIANEFDASLRALDEKGVYALCMALTSNTCVTDLNLRQNCIDGESISSLVSLLRQNFFISSLDLSGNKLSCGGAAPIKEMLKTAISLKSLNLSSNNLLQEHIRIILQGVEENKTLEVLNLSRNVISKEGAVVLGRHLAKNSTIKNLDLSWNEIYGKGASVLINALKNNRTLQVFNLAYNGFRDENAPAFSAALQNNDVLLELDLTANRMTDTGANRIARGLGKNETLQVLRLAKNLIGTASALKLLQSGKTTLKELDLSGVVVNKDFLTATRHARIEREFELIVRYGWPVKGIHNTRSSKTREIRNNDHLLEIIRGTLWERRIDIKDILMRVNGPITKQDFIHLFNSSNCGINADDIGNLYDILEEEGGGQVVIETLLDELEEADGDIQ